MYGRVYVQGMVHIEGLEAALKEAINIAEAEGDRDLAGRLEGALNRVEALHRRIDRIAAPHVGDILPQIGGGK